MMLGAHLISSGRKFQSEAAAVSINLFPNLTVLLRFGTSDGVFADQGWGQVQLTKYSSTPSTLNIYQVQVLVKYSFF